MPMSAQLIGWIEEVDFVLAHRAVKTGGTDVVLRGVVPGCGDVGRILMVEIGPVGKGCKCRGADAYEASGDFRGARRGY